MVADDARAARSEGELAATGVRPPPHRALLEAISDAVIAIDDRGLVTYFGPGAEALYGVAAHEVVGRPLAASHVYRWASRQEEQEAWATLERTGTWKGRNVHVLRSGEERHVDSTVTALRDDAGRRVGLLAVIRDVTAEVEGQRARQQAEAARRESESLYRSTVRGLLETLFIYEPVLDEAGRLVDVAFRDANDAAVSQVGLPVEAIVGRRATELFGADAMRPLLARLAEVHRTGVPARWETSFGWNARRYIASAQRLPDGNLVALGLDVTELREAEEAARASEERARVRAAELEAVLDTVPAAVWIARDPRGDRIDANRFGAELLRTPRGANVSVTAPPDERPRNFVPQRDGRALSEDELPIQRAARYGEEVRDAAFDLLFDDGELRHLVGNASPLRAPDGAPKGSVGAFVDVTSRVRAETELRKSDERLRLALRAGHIGIWEYDLVRGTVEWTDETYAVLGLAPGRFGGSAQAFLELVHPDDRPTVEQRLAAALEGPASVYVCEYRVRRPDGAVRWLADMARVVRDPAGKAVRLAGTVRDITDERLAQAALLESDRRKSEFLAVLSHELRNPLAPIRNSIALLDSVPAESPTARRARDVLRRQADHLARLVDDLLDLSRIEHGKMVVQLAPVDARELVRRAYLDARVLFDARGVELVLSEPEEPLWIEADPARFAQLLGNLFHNALKFTPPRGLVQVEIGRRGSTCEVRVKDSGQGLEPADLERIFDPFEQAARSRDPAGGLGLGLALVKRLAAKHHGTVSAHSEGPGRGAEFVLSLPLIEPPATAPGPSSDAPPAKAAALSIVLVEDNEDAATTLAELLALDGHRVRIAATGRDALQAVAAEPPDVLISDVGLPDMSGYDVIRALRSGPGGDRLFSVALTGYAQPRDREEALAAGFDAHLPKPPALAAVEALLADAGRRKDAAPATHAHRK